MVANTEFTNVRAFIESLKRYNRYELKDEDNKSLLKKVYVDPLPDNGVLNLALNDNTCFFVGRRGTGKSTIFLKAQELIRSTNDKLAIYLDIKSVFAQAQLSSLEVKKYTDALGEEGINTLNNYLLNKAFIAQFLTEVTTEISEHLKIGLSQKLFTNRETYIDDARAQLMQWSEEVLTTDTYRDIALFVNAKFSEKDSFKKQSETAGSIEINGETCFSLSKVASKLGFNVKSRNSGIVAEESAHELQKEYKEILTLYFDVKSLLGPIADVLRRAGFSKTYIFLDDFSEVEEFALKTLVDVLVAPLNNWSNDFYKYKIAAYPDRVYYGSIDKSKIDEVSIDFYDLYASKKISDLEQKAIDFTKRIFERRSGAFLKKDFLEYVDINFRNIFYEEVFKATMNNPRRMGYLLHYCFNSQIVHGHRITITAFRDATIKLFNEKDDAVFQDNVKIQQAYGERLMVQSQRELLQAIIKRAKELPDELRIDGSAFFNKLPNIYTSHFYIHKEFEFLLATLEHNFFISKYHEQQDRDGQEVTVYSLNYGLCQKHGILFGRPEKTEQGKYYTERKFNYLPTIQLFLKKFITIKCSKCGREYPSEQLAALKLYDMLCPSCREGKCELSLGYKALVDEIEQKYKAIQLPVVDFEILRVIHGEPQEIWYPSLIAEEIDTNYQTVTSHAEKLIALALLSKQRKVINGRDRTIYSLTALSQSRYFS